MELSEPRRLSIILTTWNSAPFMPRCLAGIAGQTWPDVEVIAVDNASHDGTAEVIARTLPQARIIANRENRGFSGAVNQGVAIATGAFVLLCNPDAFLNPDYAARLIAALDAAGERFGMAGGKLFRGEGMEIRATDIIDTKGIRMTRSGRHFDIGQGLRDGADDRGLGGVTGLRGCGVANAGTTPRPRDPATPRPVSECFGVSGAAPIYRRTFIDDVTVNGQFLDEDFFSYREDADVSWRGQLFGWRALHVPEAVAVHVRTVTPEKRRQLSPEVNMHSVKNRFLLRLKNEGTYLALRNGIFEWTRDAMVIGACLTIERTSLPALAWLWKNRRRIMGRRREIQRRRQVPDRALAKWFR
jgi:GT2 family glycosyltransferase